MSHGRQPEVEFFPFFVLTPSRIIKPQTSNRAFPVRCEEQPCTRQKRKDSGLRLSSVVHERLCLSSLSRGEGRGGGGIRILLSAPTLKQNQTKKKKKTRDLGRVKSVPCLLSNTSLVYVKAIIKLIFIDQCVCLYVCLLYFIVSRSLWYYGITHLTQMY